MNTETIEQAPQVEAAPAPQAEGAPQAAPAPAPAPQTRPRVMSFHVLENGDIRVEFNSPGVEPITLATAGLPTPILQAAANDGIVARLRRYGETPETPAEKRAGILEGIEKLKAGVWTLPRGRAAGDGNFTMIERAAHEYKLAKARALGQEYTGSLADTAAELAPIIEENEAVSEAHKDAPAKEKEKALAATKLGKLKATTLFSAAWAKVKAEVAAEAAKKAAEKAAKEAAEAQAKAGGAEAPKEVETSDDF